MVSLSVLRSSIFPAKGVLIRTLYALLCLRPIRQTPRCAKKSKFHGFRRASLNIIIFSDPSIQAITTINHFLGKDLLAIWSQIHNREFQPFSLEHMAWSQRIGVDVGLFMGMKYSWFCASSNALHTRRISESKDTPTASFISTDIKGKWMWGLRRILARSTNNGYTFGNHDLIRAMRVQISATHEASLCRMGVDPSKDHCVFLRVYIIEESRLVDHLTCVACVLLFGDDNLLDEDRVRDNSTAQHTACFQIPSCV